MTKNKPVSPSYRPDDLRAAAQFLIDAQRFVASQLAPQGYRQNIHSDAAPYGDGRTPYIVDASYDRFGEPQLSISFPEFTPQEALLNKEYAQWLDDECKGARPKGSLYNTGFNYSNLGKCLKLVLEAQGIKISDNFNPGIDDGGGGCVGGGLIAPETQRTVYLQVGVAAADFEKGRRIINAWLRSPNIETPEHLFAVIRNPPPFPRRGDEGNVALKFEEVKASVVTVDAEAVVDAFFSRQAHKYIPTNKGLDVVVFNGTRQELKALQNKLQKRGVQAVYENGAGGFGEGLRVKTESMKPLNAMMSAYYQRQQQNTNSEPGVQPAQELHDAQGPQVAVPNIPDDSKKTPSRWKAFLNHFKR